MANESSSPDMRRGLQCSNLASKQLSDNNVASSPSQATPLDLSNRLLSLPRELRDQIYEQVFNNEVEIKWYREWDTSRPTSEEHNAGLTLVNKQVHQETIDLYYAKTRFICYDYNTLIGWWSHQLSAKARDKITRITLVCVAWNGMDISWKEETRKRNLMFLPKAAEVIIVEQKDLPLNVTATFTNAKREEY